MKRENITLEALTERVEELEARLEDMQDEYEDNMMDLAEEDEIGPDAEEPVEEFVPPWLPPRLYDIFDVTPTTFKIYLGNSAVYTAGLHKGIWCDVAPASLAYSGLTEASSGQLDKRYAWSTCYSANSGTVSASAWVWLLISYSGGTTTATLKTGASITDVDADFTQVFPHWYIPWDTDHIDRHGIVDLREKKNAWLGLTAGPVDPASVASRCGTIITLA